MAEYVTKEQIIDWFSPYGHLDKPITFETLVSDLDCMKAADVEPVRYGRWEPVLEGVYNLPTPVLIGWRCSQCGRTEQEKEPYCNCGAKMDEEVGHD